MISSAVLFLMPLATASDRLQSKLVPVHQRIELDIDPAEPTFDGHVQITVDVPPGVHLDRFRLHGEGLDVHQATIRRQNGRSRPAAAAVEVIGDTQLQLTPRRRMRPGRYLVEIAYRGTLHEQPYGLYRFQHGGEWYVVSQLEADEARTAWPSFDEPAYKIPWQLTVDAPLDLKTISNAPVASRHTTDGSQQVEFGWTPPMPSYAVALAVGPYVGTEVPGMTVPSTVWTTRGRESLAGSVLRELPGITAWLEAWFESPYPYEKLDFVAVPLFAFGAMENPGCVVIHEGALYDRASATPGARRNMIRIAAHEVAHMWFGDLVTMAWWDDLWLNEAFATWMGVNALHALAPEFRDDVRRVGRVGRMVARDGVATSRPLRTEVDPAAVFETSNFAVYPKGEALLDMTRAWIGPDAFRAALSRYLERHAWSNASATDLFVALQAASGKPVAEMLTPFLDRPGAPWLRLHHDDEGWHVTQQRYALLGETLDPAAPWVIPMRVRVGYPGGTSEVIAFEMRASEAPLPVPADATWVHPAVDGIGYYAWSLDDAGWQALLDAVARLPATERRAVVEALKLEVSSGVRPLDTYFAALARFDEETDPAVLDAVIDGILQVRVVRLLEDPAIERRMNHWIRARLRPHLDRIGIQPGLEPAPDTARLRQKLLRALARAGDLDVQAHGRAIGAAFLEDSRSVALDQGQWGVSVLARLGDRDVQSALFARAEATDDLRLSRVYAHAAGTVPGEDARLAALNRALAPTTPVHEGRSLVEGVRESRDRSEERDQHLSWVMEHYDALASSLSPVHRMRLAAVSGGCSPERLARGRTFFSDPSRAVPGVDRILDQAERGVARCVERRERQAVSARAFLEAWRSR